MYTSRMALYEVPVKPEKRPALISSLVVETRPTSAIGALYEFARLGPQLASPCANLRLCQNRRCGCARSDWRQPHEPG